MPKKLIALLIVLLAMTAYSTNGRLRAEVEVSLEGIVQLRTYSLDGVASCSGFIVKKDIIITAGHCIHAQGAFAQKVVFSNKKTVDYTVVFASFSTLGEKPDFAIIKADTDNRASLRLADHSTLLFEPVQVIGVHEAKQYASPGLHIFTRGVESFFALSVVHGDSGGPIVNKHNGLVLGVTSSMFRDGPLATGAPIKIVIAKLRELGLNQ